MKIFDHSEWIWEKDSRKNSYVGAFKRIVLGGRPEKIEITLFADTHYKLYVNGRFVNAGPAPFAKPVMMADSYDISSFLKKGGNDIFILAHFVGVTVKYNITDRPGIIAGISGICENGKKIEAHTDSSWKIFPLSAWNKDTPKKNWAIGFIEDLDLCDPSFAVLECFASQDYNSDGKRIRLAEIEKFAQKPVCYKLENQVFGKRRVPYLQWNSYKPLKINEIYRDNPEVYKLADSIRLDNEYLEPEFDNAKYNILKGGTVKLGRNKGDKGFTVLYDMMRMMAGDISAEITAPSKCTVDLQYVEDIRDGRPYGSRMGSVYYSRFHLKKGLNKFRIYNFIGYRYIYIVLKDFTGELEIKNVTGNLCHADLDFQDKFFTEDKLLGNIYDISRRSIILNAQANTYDCNTREQGTYWGDSLWVADTCGHMTGDFSFMKDLCLAMPEEYARVGTFNASLYGSSSPLFDYCLVPMDMLRRYYEYTADRQTVIDSLEPNEKVLEDFRNSKDRSGLILLDKLTKNEKYKDGMLFLDHPGTSWHPMQTSPIDRNDCNAGINLFYLKALQCMESLYRMLKMRKSHSDEINEIGEKIRNLFYCPQTGLLKDSCNDLKKEFSYSQITNSLAVMTGILKGKDARFAMLQIIDIERNPWISQGTPYSYFFISEALSILGMASAGISTIKKYWTPMLERGATTTWEAFGGENHDSLNHAWSAPLPYLIYKGLLGLRPGEPGYTKLIFRPCIEALDDFSYSLAIPQGRISAKWRKTSPKAYELEITAPENLPATVQLGDKTIPFIGKINIPDYKNRSPDCDRYFAKTLTP